MNRTSAAETSTHAVFPLSSFMAAESCPGFRLLSGKGLGRLPRGDEDGGPDRGERRRVGEVEGGHVLDGHAGGDGGGDDVDALGGAVVADDLGAEHPPAVALGEE